MIQELNKIFSSKNTIYDRAIVTNFSVLNFLNLLTKVLTSDLRYCVTVTGNIQYSFIP